jgi:hypothetical protein
MPSIFRVVMKGTLADRLRLAELEAPLYNQAGGQKRMEVIDTTLADVKILRPRRFGDDRGWFAEVFSSGTFASAGIASSFVQDNQSFSRKGVLRGLHYQLGKPRRSLANTLG